MIDFNPLLADTDLPDFAAIKAEHVLPAVEQLIADHRAAIDAITHPARRTRRFRPHAWLVAGQPFE